MTHIESPSVSVSRPGQGALGSDPRRTVVWVRGEHDIATRAQLSVTIAQAAGLDEADVVVDLSGVTFMDASTIGALVGARNCLRSRSRSLTVRAPSGRVLRLIDLCGLARLIDQEPAQAGPATAPSLGSWVVVPAGHRRQIAAPSPASRTAPSQELARASAPVGEAAGSTARGRLPS